MTTTPKTVAELAQELETARAATAEAKIAADGADALLKSATAAEKAAYKAFNEAVDAMRPKRPRQAKAEQSPPAAA